MTKRVPGPAAKASAQLYANQDWFKKRNHAPITLSSLQLEFLEWLVDPDRVGSQQTWADAHGVTRATTTDWKKKPIFVDAWNARMQELNIGPERIQAVLNAMYKAAVEKGDTRAQSLYLQYADKYTPKSIVVHDTKVSELSDDELAAYLSPEGRDNGKS